jgi:hypothetical protein
MNGVISDVGTDDCNTGFNLRAVSNFGVKVTNYECTGIHDATVTGSDPVPIRVPNTFKGRIQFVNGAIWGTINSAVRVTTGTNFPTGASSSTR